MPRTSKTSKTKATVPRNMAAHHQAEPTAHIAALHALSPNLPDPEELAKYEKVIPGGAERILELAERQFEEESTLAARKLETSARTTRIKQIITFVLALAGIALGSTLLLQGSELAGLLVIVIDALALVGSRLYDTKRL